MKKWLYTCNEEGMTGWDAISMGIGIVGSFIVPILLIKIC